MLFCSMKGIKRWIASAAVASMLGASPLATPVARADEKEDLKVLLQRLEKLEKQNQDLQQRLQDIESPVIQDRAGAVAEPKAVPASPPSSGGTDLKQIVDDYLKEKDKKAKEEADRKKKEAEEKGHTVGDNLGMTVKWDHGLWAETADKAFRVHVGGRTQFDTVFYQAGDIVQFANNGVGRVDDGVAFRRARLAVEGTLWEVIDFNCEYDFLNTDTLTQNATLATTRNAAGALTNATLNAPRRVIDTPVPTDLWIQVRNPYLNLRIGNLKPAISFEHNTSSRFLNFLERSYGFDAYIGGPDNGFTPGILAFRNFLDDRVHFSASLTKFNQTIYGFNTGDGEYAACVRVGAFPVYDDNGRCAVWVGCGYRHNDSDFLVQNNRQFAQSGDGQVRLRARSLLRNGPAELHTPLLDIFPFAESQDLINPEFAAVIGPWTVAAEYYGSWLHKARANANDVPTQTQLTHSAYVEVLYFLTGEHRVFNRQIPGFTRVVPHENFWLVKDGQGSPYLGRGAWQVGARYNWIDLADKNVLGGNNIIGSAQSVTLGLNWFLNPNLKFQWNYTLEQRYGINARPRTDAASGFFPTLPSNGELHGFGMRMALDF